MTDAQPHLPGVYGSLNAYWGDIHSHCDISYGHGSLEDALDNARQQLDFTSITAHAHWPDLPQDDARLERVNAYHREGFERALRNWPRYRETVNTANIDDAFVTLLSFEWHSLQSGDHNVYYKGEDGDILPVDDLEAMRVRLRQLAGQGTAAMLIPHHIGYRQGYRGINWAEFTSEFSPFVEIYSMHGTAESDDAPYPYLHTMGPLDSGSTMQQGLGMGNVFGVVGSTDSHSAHPGSYGHGRLGLWARELTRAGIWEALASRRTVALTGDNIEVALAVNSEPIGSFASYDTDREIEVAVTGGDTLDYVELMHNNRVLRRWDTTTASDAAASEAKVHLELGWGEGMDFVDWNINLHVRNGRLLTVEPRFRGWDIVSPQQAVADQFTFSRIVDQDEQRLTFTTRSWPNPTTFTPGTQGASLTIEGDDDTLLTGRINGYRVEESLGALRAGSRTGYLGGFLSPAWRFHRAALSSMFRCSERMTHHSETPHDWYYVRVRQKNNQWAWSSPIWVSREAPAN